MRSFSSFFLNVAADKQLQKNSNFHANGRLDILPGARLVKLEQDNIVGLLEDDISSVSRRCKQMTAKLEEFDQFLLG